MVNDIAHLKGPTPFKSRTSRGKASPGLSGPQALALAHTAHPQLFTHLPTRALQLPPGAKLMGYINDFSARIDVAGHGVIAQSTTPLRVTQDGAPRPVDLTLLEVGTTIEPTTPVVALSFPETLGDGITLAKNIHVRVLGARIGTAASRTGQQVFYANALKDADVFATPLPTGFETFVQLRSMASPRAITYAFDLPEGARLAQQPSDHAGVAVLQGNEVLATIDAPTSTDANGKTVPTTMRVDGLHLIVGVDITPATALPVLVDPVVTDNQFGGGNSSSGYGYFAAAKGWRRETSGAIGDFTWAPNSDAPTAGGTCYRVYGGSLVTINDQLCVSTQSTRTYGGSGGVGQWSWRPPTGIRGSQSDGANIPTDAYIYRAYVRHSYARFSASAGSYMFGGLRSGRTGAWMGSSTNIDENGNDSDYRAGGWTSGVGYTGAIYNGSFLRNYCAATNCSFDHPNEPNYDGTYYSFGLYALGSGHSASANAQGAIFYEYDRTPPVVAQTTNTDLSTWKTSGTVSTTVVGGDKGMGMKHVNVSYTNKNGTTTTDDRSTGCDGSIQNACPATYSQTFLTNVDNLPEGSTTISGSARDVLDKPAATPSNVTVKVDRSSPSTTLGGDRADDPDNYLGGHDAVTLSVAASEPTPNASSGVAHIGVEDPSLGELAGSDIACPTVGGTRQCPATSNNGAPTDLTFNSAGLLEGTHQIHAVSRDDAGNRGSSADTTIIVDRTAPAFDAASEFHAALDATTHDAVVLWDPAIDPDLRDSTPGSMTSVYDIRYKRASADWSTSQRVDQPRFLIPSSTVGDSLQLEITPIDRVGNTGTTKTVSMVVTAGGDICAATAEGYPPDCGLAEPDPEDNPEEPATLVEDTTGTRSAGDNPAKRYRIHVNSPGGWTTFRSWRQSYVIGNAHDGWSFDQVSGQDTSDAALSYRHGMILGGLNQCGWLGLDFRGGNALPSDGVTSCPPIGVQPLDRPVRSNFMSSVNCNQCAGGYAKFITAKDLDDPGTQAREREVPVCLNLDQPLLSFTPYPSAPLPRYCRNRVPGRITKASIAALPGEQHGYEVQWRYVTRGSRKWVMVRDGELSESRRGEGFWYFIPRWALGKAPLCPHAVGDVTGKSNCVNESPPTS